jgi:branched-chain amino acid transport system permease protein
MQLLVWNQPMQILVNGILSGLSLALLAVAFSLVYLPTRVFYIALGGVYTLVPFLALAGMQSSLPWYVVVFAAILGGTLLSLGCERFNHQQLDAKGAPSGAHLISSLGIYIVVTQLAAMFWGNETKVLRTGLDQVTNIADVILTQTQELTFVVASAMLLCYYAWLRRSKAGLMFRAMADNPDEFALRGHSLRNMRMVAFGLSGLLASVSSLLVANDVGFDAHGGLNSVLLAVVAVIIGGRRSFAGPFLGAMCLGLLRSFIVFWLSAQWAEAFTFAVLALVLLLRPEGLLGSRCRLEATA